MDSGIDIYPFFNNPGWLWRYAYGDGIFDSISEVSEEETAEGPQEVANLLGVDLEYKPRFNDWPNVIDPSLQYWPRKQTFKKR